MDTFLLILGSPYKITTTLLNLEVYCFTVSYYKKSKWHNVIQLKSLYALKCILIIFLFLIEV